MDAYRQYNLTQLKNALRKVGLSTQGKKEELIQRLYQHDLQMKLLDSGHLQKMARDDEDKSSSPEKSGNFIRGNQSENDVPPEEQFFLSIMEGKMPQLSEIKKIDQLLAQGKEESLHDQLLDYFSAYSLDELEKLFDNWAIPTQNLYNHDEYVDRFLAFIETYSSSGYLFPDLDPAFNPE